MILELQELLDNYPTLKKTSEYISIHEVANDINSLIREVRIKRIPKHLR